MTRDFIDIELFPCAGGFAEGFRRAGVHFDMAVEWLENHCDSYEHNIGHRPIQMDVRDLHRMLLMGWRPHKRVRILSSDPPCTPWSRAGKRMGQEDPRDMLWGTCEIIALLQPDVYLIGNVPGLDDGPNLPIVQRTIGALSKHGYCTADFARLDAANYGTPQHRIRPFWFGHKSGPCIMWPRPTHGDPELVLPNLTLPGVDELQPWITCRQALGHLTPDERGRPIKLRRRAQNSKQHGSVPERPARVVGTSNLSDGNVILNDDQPRAGRRGRKMAAAEPLELQHGVAKRAKVDKRPPAEKAQGNRVGDLDQPAATVTAKPPRKGAGAHSVFTIQDRRGGKSGLAHADAPAPALVRNTHGNGSILVYDDDRQTHGTATVSSKHPAIDMDKPATTIRGGGDGHSAPPFVIATNLVNDKHPPGEMDAPAPTIGAKQRQSSIIKTSAKHPASSHTEPANTIRASDGEGANRAVEWPWDRPATTVLGDERLGPPGHHDESFSIMNTDGDGIVISEKAASILQGFPYIVTCGCGESRPDQFRFAQKHGDICGTCKQAIVVRDWIFVGESKKKRFSQLGQAMPPPLAHAVATSVVEQLAKTPVFVEVPMLSVISGGVKE